MMTTMHILEATSDVRMQTKKARHTILPNNVSSTESRMESKDATASPRE